MKNYWCKKITLFVFTILVCIPGLKSQPTIIYIGDSIHLTVDGHDTIQLLDHSQFGDKIPTKPHKVLKRNRNKKQNKHLIDIEKHLDQVSVVSEDDFSTMEKLEENSKNTDHEKSDSHQSPQGDTIQPPPSTSNPTEEKVIQKQRIQRTSTMTQFKDTDSDGIPDYEDNCPQDSNTNQHDTDDDDIGNVCDPDDDNDGSKDSIDCSPTDPAIFPGAKEICNGSDNNCDDIVDNDIPDIIDDYEPNESCNSAKNIDTVTLGIEGQTYTGNIYPDGDKDYYRFFFQDIIPSCQEPMQQPKYTLEIGIELPVFQDLDVYLYDDSCNLLKAATRSSQAAEKLTYTWKGTCWNFDSQYFRVWVKDKSNHFRCNTYTMKITVEVH